MCFPPRIVLAVHLGSRKLAPGDITLDTGWPSRAALEVPTGKKTGGIQAGITECMRLSYNFAWTGGDIAGETETMTVVVMPRICARSNHFTLF